MKLPLANAAEGQGLSKLWARRKIADAEVARTLRKLKPEEADGVILKLALDHHLVSRLTSLVAVDKTPSRPEGAKLTRADVPLNLPAGWDFDKVFGERTIPAMQPPAVQPTDLRRADRAAGRQLAQLDPAAFRAVAQSALPRPAAAPAAKGVALPTTATDAELRMGLGLALLALSLILLMIGRRRARVVSA